jgi:protein-disulfide isomerase
MKRGERSRTILSRRSVLGSIAVGTVGVAGCLGLGGGVSGGSDDPPVKGDPEASVTLESFEDFTCGACGAYTARGFPTIDQQFLQPGSIRYEHRDYPVIGGTESNVAANAARAAYHEGGSEAFWEFKSRLMANQDGIGFETPGLYGEVAQQVGLDPDRIETAATDREFEDAIGADESRGQDLGLESTPSFVLDGNVIDTSDAASIQGVVAIVSEEITSALEETSGGGGY